MTSEETYLVSLSLSLGFTQMIGQLRNADLVLSGNQLFPATLETNSIF